MSNFNKLLLLLMLLFLTLCTKFALADEALDVVRSNCYYGTEATHSLKNLQELSRFTRKTIEQPWAQFQYNGRSVTASEYERLVIRDRGLPKSVDPSMAMP
jgi:hypothetical protein